MPDVELSVVWVNGKQGTSGLGRFRFLSPPTRGDRVMIPAMSGELDLWEVLYVEHSPVIVPTPMAARPDATATVFVGYIGAAEE